MDFLGATVRRLATGFTHASIKTRISLATLVIVLAGSMVAGLYGSRILRSDLQRLLSTQQFETSKAMATAIDHQIAERIAALSGLGLLAGEQAGRSPAALQSLLASTVLLQQMFSGGTFITDANGRAVASLPASAQRVGLDYGDRDYVRAVLATGQPAVGRPVLGRALGVPVVVLAAPVRTPSGRVVGVVAGVIDLQYPGFLDSVKDGPFSSAGTFLLVAPEHRLVITASDPQRVMERMPPPGVNPALDGFVEGFEGTVILTNPQGVQTLSSVKRIPSANWYLATALPIEQAFAPAQRVERHLLAATTLLGLLLAALTWWMIRRQLTPLHDAIQSIAAIPAAEVASGQVHPLPLTRQDEIGKLLESFNHLLSSLRAQHNALERSELLYSTAFRTIPDATLITRLSDGTLLAANDSFSRVFGWKPAEVIGRKTLDLGLWQRPADRQALVDTLRKQGVCEDLEAEFVNRDGHPVTCVLSASRLDLPDGESMLAVVHDITARKKNLQQIETLAFSDPATGLPNRRLFLDRLSQALLDVGTRVDHGAVLLAGIDNFRALQSRIGYEQAEAVLRALARRLDMALHHGETVAYLGGDEFAILLRNLGQEEISALVRARQLADALRDLFHQPVQLGSLDYHGTASVGLALFGGLSDIAGQPTPHDVLTQAELALAHAQAGGGGTTCVFEASLGQGAARRNELESSLHAALESRELELHYQPQVDSAGALVGVEALMRWRHPTRGMVSPAEFIPVAEETGLIIELGQWALDTACRQLAEWARDPVLSRLRIAVNISSRQFRESHFTATVLDTLDRHGVEPRLLQLELTESMLLDDIDTTGSRMHALRGRGVTFALDDFGTGFSSLAYLRHLPLDELKIDQRFVRDIDRNANDLSIARTIVALGHSLGMKVIAEGVETAPQRDALASVSCDMYQGYLFGPAVPASDIEALARGAAKQARAAAQAVAS